MGNVGIDWDKLADEEIIDRVRGDIDEDEEITTLSDWEVDFIESILQQENHLSSKQRNCATKLLEKYL